MQRITVEESRAIAARMNWSGGPRNLASNCVCQCGTVYTSQWRIVRGGFRLTSEKACPQCGLHSPRRATGGEGTR